MSLREPLARYTSDERIRYCSLGERRGAVANMNALLAAGNSTYVALLHDDDRWHPEFLERRVAFLEQNPDCGFAFSRCAIIDDSGRRISMDPPLPAAGRHEVSTFLPLLVGRNLIKTPTVVVRRIAYQTVGGFDYSFPTIYDYEMWIRLAAHFPAGLLATCDADWRVHGDQVTYDPGHLRSAEYERLLERISELAPPALRPHPRLANENLADRLITDSLNAGLCGDRAAVRKLLAQALSTHPRSLLDPRVAVAVTSALLGRTSRKRIERLIWRHRRRQRRSVA